MPAFVIKDSWLLWAINRAGRYVAGGGGGGGRGGGGGGGGRGFRTKISFDYEFLDLIIYDRILDYELNSQEGQVGRWMKRQAYRVIAGAKSQVGVRTGRLRDSIRILDHRRNVEGQEIHVGSLVPYAYVHHEGTKPYPIFPKPGKQVLRFNSGMRIVHTRKVMHPGFKPNRYLKDNIKLIEGIGAS